MKLTPKKRPPIDFVFRAFADCTRLRILHLLRVAGEVCVCDLQAVLGVPQPKVSRHLAYLRRAGMVTARKEGLWSYYALAAPGDALHRNLLKCLDTCSRDVPELTKDAARLKRSACGAKCCP